MWLDCPLPTHASLTFLTCVQPVSFSRGESEAVYKVMCSKMKGVTMVLDLSWGGWIKGREEAARMGLPFLRLLGSSTSTCSTSHFIKSYSSTCQKATAMCTSTCRCHVKESQLDMSKRVTAMYHCSSTCQNAPCLVAMTFDRTPLTCLKTSTAMYLDMSHVKNCYS